MLIRCSLTLNSQIGTVPSPRPTRDRPQSPHPRLRRIPLIISSETWSILFRPIQTPSPYLSTTPTTTRPYSIYTQNLPKPIIINTDTIRFFTSHPFLHSRAADSKNAHTYTGSSHSRTPSPSSNSSNATTFSPSLRAWVLVLVVVRLWATIIVNRYAAFPPERTRTGGRLGPLAARTRDHGRYHARS